MYHTKSACQSFFTKTLLVKRHTLYITTNFENKSPTYVNVFSPFRLLLLGAEKTFSWKINLRDSEVFYELSTYLPPLSLPTYIPIIKRVNIGSSRNIWRKLRFVFLYDDKHLD